MDVKFDTRPKLLPGNKVYFFKKTFPGLAKRLIIECQASPFQKIGEIDKKKIQSFKALVDTGADECYITPATAKKLNLKPTGQRPVFSSESTERKNVYVLNLHLPWNIIMPIEVLEAMLVKYNAWISQCNGRWHIVSATDKKSTPKLYTYAGVYESSGSAPSVLILGYPGDGVDVSPVGTLNMSMQAGAKKVKIKHDFGYKGSWLENHDFRTFSSSSFGLFESWTKPDPTNWEIYRRSTDEGYYAFLKGYEDSDAHYLEQSVEVENTDNDDFVFRMDFVPLGYNPYTNLMHNIQMPVKILVRLYDGDSTYWYLTEDGWTTTPTNLFDNKMVPAAIKEPTSWHPLSVTTGPLPCNGTLLVRLYGIQSSGPEGYEVLSGIAYARVQFYSLHDCEKLPGKLKTIATFDNSSEPGTLQDIEVMAADAPAYDNAGLIYKNITRLSDGSLTE